jgi:hypothetical protein
MILLLSEAAYSNQYSKESLRVSLEEGKTEKRIEEVYWKNLKWIQRDALSNVKIFIKQEDVDIVLKELKKEAKVFIERVEKGDVFLGYSGTLIKGKSIKDFILENNITVQDLDKNMLIRIAKIALRNGCSMQQIRDIFNEYLSMSFQEIDKEKNLALENNLEMWGKEVFKIEESTGEHVGTREDFLDKASTWVEHKYGKSINKNKIRISGMGGYLGHIKTIFGITLYKFNAGINYSILIHELLHNIYGLNTRWLDESITQKLTEDLFKELKEEGETKDKLLKDYEMSVGLLNQFSEIIGWWPIVISYITGDESFIIEALGRNGYQAWQIIECVELFSEDLSFNDFGELEYAILTAVLTNLDSVERLKKIGELMAFLKLAYNDKKITSEIYTEAVKFLVFLNSTGKAKDKIFYSINKNTYNKIYNFAIDANNPFLQKASKEMLKMSEVLSIEPFHHNMRETTMTGL